MLARSLNNYYSQSGIRSIDQRVLFIPYGIVGTWRAKAVGRQQGWRRLLKMIGIENEHDEEAADMVSETTSE